MSFMFKPLAYDDTSAVNHPQFDKAYLQHYTKGNVAVGKSLAAEVHRLVEKKGKAIIVIDGYASADTALVANLIHQNCKGYHVQLCDMSDIYKSKEVLDQQLVKNLPPVSEEDPIQLFGYIFEETFDALFNETSYQSVLKQLEEFSAGVFLLFGQGAAISACRAFADKVIYLDVTPKTAAIRTRDGIYTNLGDRAARDFEAFMRRNYFVDFEVMVKLRKELLQKDCIDYYVFASDVQSLQMLDKEGFNGILSRMSRYPFRCKPVYLEGIWGGEFIRKARGLDIPAKKLAWIFEMIPMEVSIVIDIEKELLEFPFCTFFQKLPHEIMGKECTERFDSYFPIRCNYDDTYHSDGNMSIQVHPNDAFVKKHYNDFGSQDEAYYVIATGHGAKTYAGVCDDANMDEFFTLAEKSLHDGSAVEYKRYIHGETSYPGKQIMLPAGTIHASGQNQFILELGSLTIGSYTYKIYDYLRKDAEGKQRPIHLINGKDQVDVTRNATWVKQHIAFAPKVVGEGDGYVEELLGKTDSMYYETRRYSIGTNKKASGCNHGQFTILTVVDGEHVRIYDKDDPTHAYEANFLDIIVVPAHIKDYVIENTGYQPVVVHKVVLSK